MAPIDESLATTLLDTCVAAAGAEVLVHSCAAALPWKVLQRSNIALYRWMPGRFRPPIWTPSRNSLSPAVPSCWASSRPARRRARPSVEEVAAAVVAVTDRLGFGRSALRDRIGVTPACGLAGATPQWARTAIGLARRAAEAFADDPDAI